MPLPLLIRTWTPSDVAAVARILAEGWEQAYAGFMPAAVLAPRIDPAFRHRELEQWLATEFDPAGEALLVGERQGEVVGFVVARLGDKGDLGAVAHIPLLYVARGAQNQGAGRHLLRAAVDWVEARQAGPIVISAFEGNPFAGFYPRIGGTEAKRITATIDGHELPVILYLWPSATALRAGAGAEPGS